MSVPDNASPINAPNGVADPDATTSRNPAGACRHLTLPGPAPAAEQVLQTVGRYEIVGEITRGGMGVVYRATDPALNREVAVKVVRTACRQSLETIRR
jgi:hypothetical protein